jgi:hypothetical protein
MPNPNLTVDIEEMIRAWLVTKWTTILPADSNIFEEPWFFASAQDFAAAVEDTYTEQYLCNYVMFDFGKTVDSKNKGCDDNPSVFLTYTVTMFREFLLGETSIVSSSKALLRDYINARNKFLRSRDLGYPNQIEHKPIVQVGNKISLEPCPHIAKAFGDRIELTIEVEIN